MVSRWTQRFSTQLGVALVAVTVVACGGNPPPVARPTAPAPPGSMAGNDGRSTRPPAPAEPLNDAIIVPPEPILSESVANGSLDELNRASPLKPVFFELDSDQLSAEGQQTLDDNAALLRQNPSWAITIEGHCDERGSAEYNLALGERRALAARTYLVSLGLPGDRLRTVSYGKEFPFDPRHEEAAFSKNRRAHFVITSK